MKRRRQNFKQASLTGWTRLLVPTNVVLPGRAGITLALDHGGVKIILILNNFQNDIYIINNLLTRNYAIALASSDLAQLKLISHPIGKI